MKRINLLVLGLLLGNLFVGAVPAAGAEVQTSTPGEGELTEKSLPTPTVAEPANSTTETGELTDAEILAQTNLTAEQLAKIQSLPEVSEAQVNRALLQRSAPNTLDQTKVVNEVKRHIGKWYLWGGTGPDRFDCSGLAQYSFKRAINYELKRVTWQQEKQGKEASLKSLKAGDLLFYGARNNSTHVSIYIGNGIAIHAPQPNQKISAYEIKWWMPQFARRMITEIIPNGSIVALQSHAKSYADGSLVSAADRKKGFTVTGYKDIPEKWGSRRIYSVKESKKMIYELDLLAQTSPYQQIKNGMTVSLKPTIGAYESGGKPTTAMKNNGYVVESMKYIAKQFNSIRAYKMKGYNQWFYENDVVTQTSPYKETPKGSSVTVKKSGGAYESGGRINPQDKTKAYFIENMKYIKKKFNSIRAYKLKGHKSWFYENDIVAQSSPYREHKSGTKLVLKSGASGYYGGQRFNSSEKNRVFVVQQVLYIPKRYTSIRLYKMKGGTRWIYEQDLQTNTSNFQELKKGRRFTVRTSARLYQSGGVIVKNDYKKTFTVDAVRDIRKKYNSVRAYRAKGTNRWFYEGDLILK